MMLDMCLPSYQRAAAAFATFELRVRMLADSGTAGTPLQKKAIGSDLSPLIDEICIVFKVSDADRSFLKSYASVRNKFFHLELSRVTGRIRPLAEQLSEGNIWTSNIGTGEIKKVSDTSTSEGRIYGWMLESHASGAFAAVTAAAQRAIAIIEGIQSNLTCSE